MESNKNNNLPTKQRVPWGISFVLFLVLAFTTAGCGSASSVSDSGLAAVAGSGDATSAAAQTTTTASVSAMNKGDIYVVELTSTTNIDFSGADADAEYKMILQSTNRSSNSSNVSISSSTNSLPSLSELASLQVSKSINNEDNVTDMTSFAHDALRTLESLELDPELNGSAEFSMGKSLGKSINVSDQDTFKVLSSLSSISTFDTVTATAKCVNSRVAFYVDDDDSAAFTDAQITALCSAFNASLGQTYSLLGDAPDINSDGVVVVLATSTVNEIGSALGGIVTGFFFGGDLLSNTGSNPASNEMEIVYVLVPDDTGAHGNVIPTSFAMSNLLTAVVPHEVQHLLNYNQHVLVNAGSTESSWLNEGLSHLIEDLVGYGQENPSRVDIYLDSPSTALIPSSSPGLAARGASYLFLRHLYEQAADQGAFLSNLVNTDQTGVANVETAFAGNSDFDDWKEMLIHWSVAVAATDQNITNDSEYIYQSRTFNSTTGHYQGICMSCSANDGRGTVLSGPRTSTLGSGSVSMGAGGMSLYNISSAPDNITLNTGNANMQMVLIRTE